MILTCWDADDAFKLVILIAADAVNWFNELKSVVSATVTLNVDASPLVKVITLLAADAVTNKLPVDKPLALAVNTFKLLILICWDAELAFKLDIDVEVLPVNVSNASICWFQLPLSAVYTSWFTVLAIVASL